MSRSIVACFAASMLAATSAHAADLPAVVVERGPGADACPDATTFVARVAESQKTQASRPSSPSTSQARSITVRFERTATGYASTMRTAGGLERSLDDRGASCDGLAEATLLAVKLAFDSSQDDEPAVGAPPEPPPSLPARHEEASSAKHVELLAGAMAASIGIGSSFAPGMRASGGLAFGGLEPVWWLGATGFALPAQSEQHGSGSVDVELMGGGIESCRRMLRGDNAVGLCARAEAARLAGRAHGFVKNEEAARPLFLASLLLRGQRRLAGPLGVFAELGVTAPILRERFEIQGVGLVYDPPVLGVSGGLGLLLDLEGRAPVKNSTQSAQRK